MTVEIFMINIPESLKILEPLEIAMLYRKTNTCKTFILNCNARINGYFFSPPIKQQF